MKYEYRYFRKGTNIQSRADIIVTLNRPDENNFIDWTDKEFDDMKKNIENDLVPVVEKFISDLTK